MRAKKSEIKGEVGSIERREFMKLMGASMSLAGLTSCTRQPKEKIVPYVDAPEEVIPGKPLFFATAFPMNGLLMGVLAESHMGRPTKIEGNELHPASLGSSDVFAQASALDLYDPARSNLVMKKMKPGTWLAFSSEITKRLEQEGKGIRLLLEPHSSPTLADQITSFEEKYPEAKVHYYSPVGDDNIRAGLKLAFGKELSPVYHLDKAEVIVSLDMDFVSQVRYARDFASGRDLTKGHVKMNRLYVLESSHTPTGLSADHRLPTRASRIEILLRIMAAALGMDVGTGGIDISEAEKKFLAMILVDLPKHHASCVVIPGDGQPPLVHALAHALNKHLGNVGKTVEYIKPVLYHGLGIKALAEDMHAGKVDTLLMLGTNPAYNTPADCAFGDGLKKVSFKAHAGLYVDETAQLCDWHIPLTHYLESWGDGRAFDGTASIIQPLIEPLHGWKSLLEIISLLNGKEKSGHELLRNYWKSQWGESGFENAWRKTLHDGLIKDSASNATRVRLRGTFLKEPVKGSSVDQIEVVFRPDPAVWDGAFSNNSWLQELPKPITTLAWDNAIVMGPKLAQQLGLMKNELPKRVTVHPKNEVLTLNIGDREITGPVLIVPGTADDSVTVYLGYGRKKTGGVGDGLGYNAYHLRTSEAPWIQLGVKIKKTGKKYPLALTQDHHRMEGRALLREGSLNEYKKHPEFAKHMGHQFPDNYTLYDPKEHLKGKYQWGMIIDLTRCTSCNACVLACHAENNTAVVGKREMMNGRELHWIRLDRYFDGDRARAMPVACGQCELAPCETVCPVGATTHSEEGINQMVYNRCVGTRYCSNNCPYKVRRYNYFQYGNLKDNTLRMVQNPNVTTRVRGVMEKCTYCIQRINHARIEAKIHGRDIREGEVKTACQQACPTQAIVFGDIKNEESAVAALREEPRAYALLGELNTRPRTLYLAKVNNVMQGNGHHKKGH